MGYTDTKQLVEKWHNFKAHTAKKQLELQRAQSGLAQTCDELVKLLAPADMEENDRVFTWINTEKLGFKEKEKLLVIKKTFKGFEVYWYEDEATSTQQVTAVPEANPVQDFRQREKADADQIHENPDEKDLAILANYQGNT